MAKKIKFIFPLLMVVVCVFSLAAYAEDPTPTPFEDYTTFTNNRIYWATPEVGITPFYLLYNVNNVDTWIQAQVSSIPGFGGFQISAPVGYSMKDAKGLAIKLYAVPSGSLKSLVARFILTVPSYNDGNRYVDFFAIPHFEDSAYWYQDEQYKQKLSLGFVNDSYAGDEQNPGVIDITFYQLCDGISLDDNSSDGNLMFKLYFDAQYNQIISIRMLDGYCNGDIAQTITTLQSNATQWNSPDFQNENFLGRADTFITNLGALIGAYDPLNGLSVAQSLQAVYNPPIQYLAAQGGIAFLILILVFIFIVIAIVTKWLRRE